MPYDPTLDQQAQSLYASIQGSPLPANIKADLIRQYQQKIGTQNYLNPNDYFSPDLINQFFNASRGNLLQNQAYARAGAQSNAASLAGSRNLLNPSGFTLGAGTRAAQPYVSALGSLEASRTGALQQNQQGLYQALFNLMNSNRQYGLQQQQFGLQRDAQTPDFMDYASAFLPGAAYLKYLGVFGGGKAGTGTTGTTGTTQADLPPGFSYDPQWGW